MSRNGTNTARTPPYDQPHQSYQQLPNHNNTLTLPSISSPKSGSRDRRSHESIFSIIGRRRTGSFCSSSPEEECVSPSHLKSQGRPVAIDKFVTTFSETPQDPSLVSRSHTMNGNSSIGMFGVYRSSPEKIPPYMFTRTTS